MSVPLTIQLFDAALGTQEGIHSVILPNIFSSGGSKNVYIDKYARVKRINGYDNNNSSAITTNTGGSAAMVRGLIPYKGTGGGTTVRKLLIVIDDQVNEWEVWVSSDNGVNNSFLYDAGSGSVGMVPDHAQFGDDLYITNGKVQPRIYDGTSIAATGLTQSPTITSSASSNSGNLKGNYKYKLVSFIDGVRQNGSAASTVLTVVDKQVDLSWTADANTNVDGYEIYRTTGTGTTYYYLTTIGLRTTVAYTDNTSDLTLLEQRVLEEHGDAPPVCYYCEPHKQRMWWLRTDTAPTRGYWSDPGEPQSVFQDDFLDFSDSETVGDVITGAVGNFEGLLVVFTEKAIWTVSGTGSIIGDITDWTKTHTNATIGSVTSRSVARIPAGSKFTDQNGEFQTTSVSALAYFTPYGDIRIFDGENDIIVSHPVRDTIRDFNYTHRGKVFVHDDNHNSQVTWYFPADTATENDTAVCWNYQFGVWYIWNPLPFGHCVSLDTSSDAHVNIAGDNRTATGAFIYTFFGDGVNSFNGTAIEAQWMTKVIYGVDEANKPALVNTKRWRWLDVLFKVETDTDVIVEWLSGTAPDDASPIGSITVSPSQIQLISSEGSFIISTSGSFLCAAAASAQGKALLKTPAPGGDYLHDTGIRIRVKSDTSGGETGPFTLEAMELAYQILPGQKRRMNP